MSARADFVFKGKDLLAQPFHYTACGLDNVYLLNGVSETQTSYGPMTHIDNVNGLHRAIGLSIVEKDGAMEGAEFRFLRKQLELSQVELAAALGVTDQTIANYEKGKTALGPTEAYIKTTYLLHILPESTPVEVLKSMLTSPADGPRKKLSSASRRKIVQQWQQEVMATVA